MDYKTLKAIIGLMKDEDLENEVMLYDVSNGEYRTVIDIDRAEIGDADEDVSPDQFVISY